jgi:hypothetical protein
MYEELNVIKCLDCQNSFRIDYSDMIIENYKTKISMPNFFDNTLRNRHHYNFVSQILELNNSEKVPEIGSGSGSFISFVRNKDKNLAMKIIEPGSTFISIFTIQNIIAEKCKTLPAIFIDTMAQIGSLFEKYILLLIVYLKLKFSLYISSFSVTIFFIATLTKRLGEKDIHFINIALVA